MEVLRCSESRIGRKPFLVRTHTRSTATHRIASPPVTKRKYGDTAQVGKMLGRDTKGNKGNVSNHSSIGEVEWNQKRWKQ